MASPILASLTILMLGDSHFATQGYLVTTLQDALISQGAKVVTEAACGAPAGVWASAGVAPCGSAERIQLGPVKKDSSNHAHVTALNDLIAKYHPNLIIVGSGDTMAGYAQPALPAEWISDQIRQLTTRIQAANLPCVWIGPGWGEEGGPYFKNYNRVRQVNAYLASNVAPCRYIDSTAFAQPGEWKTFDGQHYTLPAYQKWGLAIDQAIVALAQAK
ncbi:SGNH/GDSL hydrolase family protein [Acidisphaera sp. L21]|jgi:hypothetical protein|uniref:SGNH/GDSL hydrolase family protein n=1 Tax=Acidisphaera sp. L21 TaxID=1641851 RepID=UPI00131EB666|nr:SGNH/GDSL hydrolase family protein [Acidisphaera sp. L21]